MTKRLCGVVLGVLLGTITVSSVSAQGPLRTEDADVVIVALVSADDSELEATRRAALKLFGRRSDRRTVQDVQLDIVRKTAAFGPVMLLTPDDDTRSEVFENCEEYELCALLAAGQVRVAVTPHQGPWIRDFGPHIADGPGGDLRVVDARYYDIRRDQDRTETLRELAAVRLELVDRALNAEDDPYRALQTGTVEEIQSRLGLLRELSSVLQEQSSYGQREKDDQAAFSIAQSLLAGGISSQSSPLFIDGGNLLRLQDGVCLTTTGLAQRNPGRRSELLADLEKLYDCRSVLELQPLPGRGVIEHVDMFALPTPAGTILLPDYRLDQPHVRAAWPHASSSERNLTFQAALAINANAALLRARGYEVAFVPSLLPRVRPDSGAYYPTMLNALVRTNRAGNHQVLVPTYAGLDQQVQNDALAVFERQFGPSSEVVGVEATVAAEGQGAIHCLTMTAPYRPSVFAQDPANHDLQAALSIKHALDEEALPESTPTLVGSWSATRRGQPRAGSGEESVRFTFNRDGLVISAGSVSTSGTYVVTHEESRRWGLEITFEASDGEVARKSRARVDWLTGRMFRLVMDDGERWLLTRPLAPEDVSAGTRVLALGEPATGVLTASDEVEEGGRPLQAWTLKAAGGQPITVSLSSPEFDAFLWVVGEGLEEALFDDDSGGNWNARLTFDPPQDGTYRVVVGAVDGALGAFNLSAMRAEPEEPEGSSLNADTLEFLLSLPADGRNARVGKTARGTLDEQWRLPNSGLPVQAWQLAKCEGRVRVELTSSAFDAVLVVAGGALSEPVINDDSTLTDSEVTFDCQKGAVYRLVVASTGGVGPFRLTVSKAAGGRD